MPVKQTRREQPKAMTRRVAFTTSLEGAKDVVVTGDFTEWSKEGIRLSARPDGSWGTTLQLAPGRYEYLLVVDGEWRDHPEAAQRVANPFGTTNCVLTVS